MLTKEEKKAVITRMVDLWKDSKSFVFYNFEKMHASEVTLLRKKLRTENAHAYVVKNTLILLSAKEAGIELDSKIAESIFQGQTGIIVSDSDPISGPKAVDRFFIEYKKPEIKGGYFEGRLLTPSQVKELATIPPREVLNQRLAYDLLAPVTKLACSLNNTVTKLAIVINALKELREKTN